MAQAESAAKEQCRAAQQEAEGHLAVLEAKQQQDGVLKDEIARLSAEVERLQDETNINKSYADAVRADIAQAEEEAGASATANARLESLQQQSDALQISLEESQSTVLLLTEKLALSEQQKSQSEADLQLRLEAAFDVNCDSERRLNEAQEELSRVRAELQEARQGFEEREGECRELQDRIGVLEEAREGAPGEEEIAEQRRKVTDLQIELKTVCGELQDVRHRLADSVRECTELQRTAASLEEDREVAVADLAVSAQKARIVDAELCILREESQRLVVQRDEAMALLDLVAMETVAEAALLRVKHDSASDSVVVLQARIEDLRSAAEQRIQENKQLSASVEALQGSNAALQVWLGMTWNWHCMELYGIGWDGMGWDGMGWDGMGWMGWDGMGIPYHPVPYHIQRYWGAKPAAPAECNLGNYFGMEEM